MTATPRTYVRFPFARASGSLFAALAATLIALPGGAEAQACPEQIQVLPGDTMSIIARECGVSLRALIAANPQVENPALIFAGEALVVPPPATRVPGGFAEDPRFRGPEPFVAGPKSAGIDPRRYSAKERRLFRRALRQAYRQGVIDGARGF